jgi:hypothetical protein
MIRRDLSIAVWMGCLAGVGIVSGVWAGPAERSSSIVFVPGTGGSLGSSADVGAVEIRGCMAAPDGLLVEGRVDAAEAPVAVVVSPGPADGSGVGVSAGYANSASKVVDARIGDFVVTLPWASVGSSFAVLDHEGPSKAPVVGPAAWCPKR